MRSFVLISLLTGTAALSVGTVTEKTEKTEKTEVESEAETASQWQDPEAATKEVIKLCGASDLDGARKVLDAHSLPLGHERDKAMLKACFYDGQGECLVSDVQCEWMKSCFATDGPCQQPPIQQIFLEIPGGEAMLEELTSEQSASATSSSLIQVNKTDSNGPIATVIDTSLWSLSAVADMMNNMIPEKLRYGLLMAKLGRDNWVTSVPDKKKRKWFYELYSLGMWFLMACGTEYNNVKMTGIGGMTRPVYAWFAPLGLFKSPAYTYPILDTKLLKYNKWRC